LKRPAKNKPIQLDKGHHLTHAAKVGQAAEQHQEAKEESSCDDFQADDANDPDYVEEDPSAITEQQQDVSDEPNGVGVVDADADDDDCSQLTFQPRIPNQDQTDNVINPCLPKPKMKYETRLIYNFGTHKQAPKRQAYLLFERLYPNSSPNPKMGIRPLQIPSTELVDGFLCENIESLFVNGLKKWSHYEVLVSDYSGYKKEAKRCGIKLHIHKGQPSPTIISEDPYQFVLHNGIDHKDMIEDLGLRNWRRTFYFHHQDPFQF
jgi:hypothetical protein